MSAIKKFLATRWRNVSAGAFAGIFAPLLQRWGNPGNMLRFSRGEKGPRDMRNRGGENGF
jgi:hypothetical protein